MADNYTFRDGDGNTKTARAADINSKLLVIVGVMAATPTITGTQVDVSVTTAQALPTIPSNSTHALLTVDLGSGNIRFREDGTNPTTTGGLLIQAGDAVELTNLANVKIVSTSGTTKVNISYRRYDQ